MDAPGNISWAITATALVLLMTPGVAFFYGGLVKAKSVVSMMMMSFGSIGLVAVLWILFGFSMSAVDSPTAFAGNPFADFGLSSLASGEGSNVALLGVAYGATFAIITVALISGAIADRAKFGSWLIFAGIFATVGYFPVAAWVWGGGWIMNLGTTLFGEDSGDRRHRLCRRYRGAHQRGCGRPRPCAGPGQAHRLPEGHPQAAQRAADAARRRTAVVRLVRLQRRCGVARGGHGRRRTHRLLNTLGATAAAILGWILVEKIKDGKPTSVGAASGAVAGLVAITPACANLTPGWALLLGALAGVVCALAIELKFRLGFDDSLDVVGIHLVGGLIGTLYLGFFASETGLFVGGDARQLAVQVIAALGVLIYSFVVAFIIGFAIEKTIGFRVTNEDEIAGVDQVVHGEEGYALADA